MRPFASVLALILVGLPLLQLAPEPPPPQASPPSAAPAGAAAPSATPPKTPPAASDVYARIGIIGASATAGFGLCIDIPDGDESHPQGLDLADVLGAAANHKPLLSRYGTEFFYMNPIRTGRDEVDRVLKARPTVVFALDFLFWHGYGNLDEQRQPITKESQRFGLLTAGLAQLDRITSQGIPVVVGDFPDMSTSIGRMLSPSQVPNPETLKALNERLRAWAAERPLVSVVNLSTLVPALDSGEEVTICGRNWCCRSDGPIVQRDRLHPTYTGTLAMIAKAVELINARIPGAPRDAFTVDPVVVRARLIERFKRPAISNRAPPPASPAAPADPYISPRH